jgi:uncharacterized Zn finger protein
MRTKNAAKTMKCSDSGKQYTDINHSEIRNEQFRCGGCGTLFPFDPTTTTAKDKKVTVPMHSMPEAVFAYRKSLEK